MAHDLCPDLAKYVVSRWIELELDSDRDAAELDHSGLRDRLQDGDWDCEVKTQTWVAVDGEIRRPDLQLMFRRDRERGIAVCVEVKDGTAPHTNQLQKYTKYLGELEATHTLVVLVAPRASYPFPENQIPRDVAQVSWQQTTRILRDYLDYRARSDAAKLLICELLLYLQEEGLMPIDRVTPEHQSRPRTTKRRSTRWKRSTPPPTRSSVMVNGPIHCRTTTRPTARARVRAGAATHGRSHRLARPRVGSSVGPCSETVRECSTTAALGYPASLLAHQP